MQPIPRTPLLLGLAGTLPFLVGAYLTMAPATVTKLTGLPIFAASLLGVGVLSTYGVVIFAFMSGVLWGFATKAPPDQAARFYVISTLPAILVFFHSLYGYTAPLIGLGQPSLLPLLIGFVGLLGLDYVFWRANLAPNWWMKMRMLITAIVVASLAIGIWGT